MRDSTRTLLKRRTTLRERLQSPDWAVRLGALGASVLSISVGLCGLNFVYGVSVYNGKPGALFMLLARLELGGMLIGASGLVVSGATLAIRWGRRVLSISHKDEDR